MNFLDQIVTFYNNLPPGFWELVLGAAGVSAITQVIKRLLALKNEKVVQVLFATVAFLATCGQYLFVDHNMPASIFGLSTAALMGVATPLYFYIIKPLDSFVRAVKAYSAAQEEGLPDIPPQAVATTIQPKPLDDQKENTQSANPPEEFLF
jgi:hypothetical protein